MQSCGAVGCPPAGKWKISFANVNSLLGKRDDIRAEICGEQYDIYGIVETKLDSSITDSEINIDDYALFRLDRKKGGGGVAAFVRNGFHCLRLKPPSDYGINCAGLEILPLRIGEGSNLVICVFIYIPKSNHVAAIKALANYIELAFHSQLHRLIILGDLNIDLLPETSSSLVSTVGGFQTVTSPTHRNY